jgi:hypothetical protein
VNEPAQDRPEHRTFSHRLDVRHTCHTCAHSIGMDGPHLWCQRTRIVVVMPCAHGSASRAAKHERAESLPGCGKKEGKLVDRSPARFPYAVVCGACGWTTD